MLLRWSTVVVWALAVASAVAWGLKLFVQPPQAPPQTVLADAAAAPRGDLTRLLGADPQAAAVAAAVEPAADARFQLVGVVSPRSAQAAREGVALIAVDGKPARAYRVGAAVDGSHVLQGVDLRGARLGPAGGAAVIALRMPPPAAASTGVLPPAVPGDGNTSAPPPMPQPSAATLPMQPQFGGLRPRLPGSAVPMAEQEESGGDELPEQSPAPSGGRAAQR